MQVTDPAQDLTRPRPPKPDLASLQASASQACALLKVLAHGDRLIILCRLAQGEFCVGELEEDLGIRQPTLSQQLGVLRQEGLVTTRREGKHIFYKMSVFVQTPINVGITNFRITFPWYDWYTVLFTHQFTDLLAVIASVSDNMFCIRQLLK